MTEVSLGAFVLCVFVTSQHTILLDVYLGTLVDSLSNPMAVAGNNASAIPAMTPEELGARRSLIVVQICLIVVLLLCIMCWAKWRLRRLERAHQKALREQDLREQTTPERATPAESDSTSA